MDIGIDAEYLLKNNYRYNSNKIDWEKFYNKIEQESKVCNSLRFLNSNVSERYSKFREIKKKAIQDALPIKKKRNNNNNNSILTNNNNTNKNNKKKEKHTSCA